MSPAVTVERYAEIRAEMDAGALRDEALARAGMTTDEWTVAQREWLEKMGTELDRGRFELSNRYSQAFLERQRALITVSAPRIAPAAAPHHAVAAPMAAAPIAASSPAPAVALPSYLQAPVIQAASPAPGLPTVSRAPQKLNATGSFVAPLRPTLPFAKPPPGGSPIATPAPAAEAAPKAAPKPNLGGTSFAIDNSAMRAALPFAGAAPAAPGEPRPVTAPPLPAAASAAPPAPAAKPKLGGTSFAIDNSAMRAALPFAGATPGSPAIGPSPAPAPPKPPPPAKPKGPPVGGETSMAIDIPREALPFPSASAEESAKPAAPKVTLTLEQYASVCAELAASPGKEDVIRKKYGIADEAAWKSLDNQWQSKFLFDATARKKWLDLTEQYRRWLTTQSR